VSWSGDPDWSPFAERVLKAAGWSERRRVAVDEWEARLAPEGFAMHAAARAFLIRYGGLAVNVSGPGRDYARLSYQLDPALCFGQKTWFDSLAGKTGGDLYPVGEEANGNASLAMDGSGYVYMLFNNQVKPVGPGATALSRLIEGEDAPDGEVR
jgi:hypothetical protein